MKIVDDLKLHSHWIAELFDKEKALREKQNAMKEDMLLHSHTIKQNSENIMATLNNQKEIQLVLSEMKAQFETFKKDEMRSRSMVEFIKELFDRPKNWIIVVGLLLLIESIKGLEIANLIRHYTGI